MRWKAAKVFVFLVLVLLTVSRVASGGGVTGGIQCYTILAGREATVDGSVILAHNEDDGGELLVDWYLVPRVEHGKGEVVRLKNGAEIGQVSRTWSYLWLEIPGLDFSDSYMNEWGVVVTSNQCPSREDSGEVVNGGIGYYLRRIVAERAKSAREAVHIAGRIIENVGYFHSGRSYCIADPEEAWVLAVVQGKHWVAQRVPDDEVAVVPNYYTIGRIDLSDTLNFLGSRDIVDYAVKRGWYSSESGEEFNFRAAYSPCEVLNAIWNVPRHLGGVNLLASMHYGYFSTLPFSFKPGKKVSIEDVMKVLAYHYEGTDFEVSASYNNGDPHHCTISRICSATNRYGFVAQLRSFMPHEVGNVLWIAPRRPCIQPFIPWYSGIITVPKPYTRGDFERAVENHFDAPRDIRSTCPDHAYWTFTDFASVMDEHYGELIDGVRTWKWDYQRKLFERQAKLEKKVIDIYSDDTKKAGRLLTEFTTREAIEVLRETERKLKSLTGNR